jgi:hypothetical protein
MKTGGAPHPADPTNPKTMTHSGAMERLIHRLFTTRWAVLLAVTVGVSTATIAEVLPVGQPEYDFLYEQQLRREAYIRDRFDLQIGPYVSSRFTDSLGPLGSLHNVGPDQITLFAFAAEDLRSTKDRRTLGYESLRGGFSGEPFKQVQVYADFMLDKELAEDPSYTGKKWRGFAGDVDQAFVSYEAHRFNLVAGRFGGFWGPRKSLLFSSEQKLDGLGYTVRWGRLALSYRLGALDGLNPDADSVTQHEPRYIAAHRIDWHFSPSIRVGVFETMVFGGPGRQIDLFYLNPLLFLHGSQLNENLNDNSMVGFDFDVQPRNGLLLWGQMLVDDIQLDNQRQGDQEPDQFGLLVGGYVSDALRQTDLKFEYERVTNWTFNQMHARNRYLNDGRPIGSALGNDYDLTALSIIHWLKSDLQASLNYSYYRQGEGRIDAPFTQPWLDVEGDYSEPFPTGTVQKTATLSLGLKGFVLEHAFVDFEAGVEWMRNRNHLAGDNPTLPFVKVYLSVFGLSRVGIE